MSPSGVEPLSATAVAVAVAGGLLAGATMTTQSIRGLTSSLLLLLQQEIAGEGDVDVDVISGDTKATPEGVWKA